MSLRHALPSAVAGATLLGALAVSSPAQACASCGCGDPTLTTMGSEQPFAGRLRGATLLRFWGQEAGHHVDTGHHHAASSHRASHTEGAADARHLRELRLDVSAGYAPRSWLLLSASMPFHARELSGGLPGTQRVLAPGDVELGAKVFLWKNREFSPEHLVSAVVGVKLPTAAEQRDAAGAPGELDAQVGSGSVDPRVGAAYAFFGLPWSLHASLVLHLPTEGFQGFRAARSLRGSLAGQYQLGTRLALRLGVDTRLDGTEALHGQPTVGSEGFIAYASPELLFNAGRDTALQLGVRVPVVSTFGAGHGETPIASLAVLHDF